MKPASLNAFDIISLFPDFVLSNLIKIFRSDARFTTQNSASTIISRIEEVASMGVLCFPQVKKKDGTVKMQGRKEGRKGKLAIHAEIFEITPAFHVVEVKKNQEILQNAGSFVIKA
ncbi:hypothetical protein FXO37_01562 [Capsicum annuum]|nr:hypothetical protein FXO37_01562 [Capsicum annuum]